MITDQGQVQIYESLMRDTDGNITYTLLRASTYSKDNRLLPRDRVRLHVPREHRHKVHLHRDQEQEDPVVE